jgi:hypothetical protein
MVFDRLRRETQLTHDQQTTRMTPAAFEQWWKRERTPSTRDYLATIRGRPPVRRVTSRAGNISDTYPSQKMGATIQREQLSLDCLQDHILPTDILRQIALDASEREKKLENTESNREHLWWILQGGELIAPIPPLPHARTQNIHNHRCWMIRPSHLRAVHLNSATRTLPSQRCRSHRPRRPDHARRSKRLPQTSNMGVASC